MIINKIAALNYKKYAKWYRVKTGYADSIHACVNKVIVLVTRGDSEEGYRVSFFGNALGISTTIPAKFLSFSKSSIESAFDIFETEITNETYLTLYQFYDALNQE